MRSRIGMLVAGGDDGACFPAGFVDFPARFVLLVADLHGALVLVPGAHLPTGIGTGQRVRDESDVGLPLGEPPPDADRGEREEQALVGTGCLVTEVTLAFRPGNPSQPGPQFPLVRGPGLDVVVADDGEVGKILTQDAGDLVVKSLCIVSIVEITEMQNHMGAFGLDHPKNGF